MQQKILCTVNFLVFLFVFFGVSIMQENLNSKSYLGTIKVQVLENLRYIQHAPSVQMQEVSST